MKEIILAYQGEMSLKGLNRATFESVLLKTMRRRLKSLGNFKIYKAQSTMYAEPAGDEDIDAAEERIGKIFGIAGISRVPQGLCCHCGHREGIPVRRAAGGKDV